MLLKLQWNHKARSADHKSQHLVWTLDEKQIQYSLRKYLLGVWIGVCKINLWICLKLNLKFKCIGVPLLNSYFRLLICKIRYPPKSVQASETKLLQFDQNRKGTYPGLVVMGYEGFLSQKGISLSISTFFLQVKNDIF